MTSRHAGPDAARPIHDALARLLPALRADLPSPAIAVACSGGLDSMVLLHAAHAWARGQDFRLFAFHVHHGLSPNAGDWLAHCERTCGALGVTFDHRRVNVEKGKSGTEQAARKLRYAALGEMCREHGAGLLLTAHHLDDQAETVLLQLLRGSGPAGLSGMDSSNHARKLLGDPNLVIARPLLSLARAELEAYARGEGIEWVDDESNLDPRFARNALRHQVMPALAQAFPGFQQRIARSAAHAQSAQRLLDELAAQDLAAAWAQVPTLPGHVGWAPEPTRCDANSTNGALSLARLRELSTDRVHNLLRHWFAIQGITMPSTAWLEQMAAQALDAREDAQLRVTHAECEIRRHRDRLYITPRLPDLPGMRDRDDIGVIHREGQAFRWNGEAQIAFPDYGGVLHFDAADEGFDAGWLRAQPLVIDFRQGGERLKLAPNRPSRGLKAHYQSLGVPAWERERLPVVSAGFDLLFAAGIGMDCRHVRPGPSVALRWEAAHQVIPKTN